jgi:hypothetical protein
LDFGLAVPDGTPNLIDLKPVKVSEGLACLGWRIANRMMRALVGHTDNFNNFVCFFWHGEILGLQLPRGMISML